jgi:hypothetical protein
VLIFFIVFLPSGYFLILQKFNELSNQSKLFRFVLIFLIASILAWLTYIGIISSETGESVEKTRKQTDKQSKKFSKDEKKYKEDLRKRKRARTAMLFTLGSFIIIPYFIYILISKMLNDPTFEGLGNFQFDSNKVLKLINEPKFQNVMRYKLWYLVILFVQVILTVGVAIIFILNQGMGNAVRIIPALIFIFIISFGCIIGYIFSRSQLSFQDPTISELDYYSVFSMGLSSQNIFKLLGFQDIVIEPTDVSFNGLNTQASAPPLGMQQGGDSEIIEKEHIPGLSQNELTKSVEKIMKQTSGIQAGDWNYIYENLSSKYYIFGIGLVIMILVFTILASTSLIKNSTKQLDTAWMTFGSISGLIVSVLLVGVIYSKIMFITGKSLNTTPVTENQLLNRKIKATFEGITDKQQLSQKYDVEIADLDEKIASINAQIGAISNNTPEKLKLQRELAKLRGEKNKYETLKTQLQGQMNEEATLKSLSPLQRLRRFIPRTLQESTNETTTEEGNQGMELPPMRTRRNISRRISTLRNQNEGNEETKEETVNPLYPSRRGGISQRLRRVIPVEELNESSTIHANGSTGTRMGTRVRSLST